MNPTLGPPSAELLELEEHERWMRIISQGISGRRIVTAELPPSFGQSAYL